MLPAAKTIYKRFAQLHCSATFGLCGYSLYSLPANPQNFCGQVLSEFFVVHVVVAAAVDLVSIDVAVAAPVVVVVSFLRSNIC